MNEKFYKVVIGLLIAYILAFNPFISDVLLPKPIRFVFPLAFYLCCFVYVYNIKRRSLRDSIFIASFLSLFLVYWLFQGTLIVSNAILVLSSIMLVLFARPLLIVDRFKFDFLTKIWNYVIWTSIVMTILSFVCFNFLNRFTFLNIGLGNYSEFNSFLSPFFGVISEKLFLTFKLGRPAWLLSEPSYLGFLQGLNFFWFYYRAKISKSGWDRAGKVLSIVSMILSLSLGSWVALLIAYTINSIKDVFFRLFRLREMISLKKLLSLFSVFILVSIIIFLNLNSIMIALDFIDEFANNIDKYSSLQDRTNRLENSIMLINESNLFQILFGRGPGTIELLFESGESNGWIKTFIEEGVILLGVYVFAIIHFINISHKNIFLAVFVLVSFNSIIILFSPLITFYIVILFVISKISFKEAGGVTTLSNQQDTFK